MRSSADKETKEPKTLESLLETIVPDRIVRTCRSDGNCGFQGVSMFLPTTSSEFGGQYLREQLYSELEKEDVKERVNEVIRTDEAGWYSLLKRIAAKSGVRWPENWMNDEAMRALSYLLNRNIFVIDKNHLSVVLYPRGYGGGKYLVKVLPPESAKIAKEDIVLLFSGNHFDALVVNK